MKFASYTNILSGSTISNDIEIRNARFVGLHLPVMTSCEVLMEAAFFQANSASYFPVGHPSSLSGSGSNQETYVSLHTGAGSISINITDYVAPYSAFRLKTLVAQTDVRTLIVSTVF